jgi:hypothetical protein
MNRIPGEAILAELQCYTMLFLMEKWVVLSSDGCLSSLAGNTLAAGNVVSIFLLTSFMAAGNSGAGAVFFRSNGSGSFQHAHYP